MAALRSRERSVSILADYIRACFMKSKSPSLRERVIQDTSSGARRCSMYLYEHELIEPTSMCPRGEDRGNTKYSK